MRCEKLRLECTYESTSAKNSPPPDCSLELTVCASSEIQEVSAIKYFAQNLAPELAGCFPAGVWCSILPRVAQQEAVIWNSLVAVSMLHRSIRLGRSTVSAIRQYDQAVQELRLRLTLPKESQRCCQDVILLSCLLFTIFECMQGSILNALRHVVGGMKLLLQWGPDEAQDQHAYLSRSTLEPVFLALDTVSHLARRHEDLCLSYSSKLYSSRHWHFATFVPRLVSISSHHVSCLQRSQRSKMPISCSIAFLTACHIGISGYHQQ